MPEWLFGPAEHYPTLGARRADLAVHVVGLVLAVGGGLLLAGVSAWRNSPGAFASVIVYSIGVVLMLAFSTAYNFAKASLRPRLRRLDHAGIFVMIAASYTPFTTQHMPTAWAWGMTTAVWTIAAVGALAKAFLPGLDKRVWIATYLAMGWLVLVALKPLIDGVSWIVLALLLAGGVIYSTGVIFYVKKQLKFARAIWHGHVITAAGVHWAAVLIGVVLVAPVGR